MNWSIFFIAFLGVIIWLNPYVKCMFMHPLKTIKYGIIDTYKFIRYKQWRLYKDYGLLDIYSGIFGQGKTLSSTIIVRDIYKRYNNKKVYDFKDRKWKTQKIELMTNVTLNDIKALPLLCMDDILKWCNHPKDDNSINILVVLIDETSTQLNSRAFKTNFTTDLLNILLTCRHHKIRIIGTTPRFNQVDALVRQVTNHDIECSKWWRLVKHSHYNAWQLENTNDVSSIEPLYTRCIFVDDSDFNAYDTFACVQNFIDNVKKGLHLTDAEILAYREFNSNDDNFIHLKKKYRKMIKK